MPAGLHSTNRGEQEESHMTYGTYVPPKTSYHPSYMGVRGLLASGAECGC